MRKKMKIMIVYIGAGASDSCECMYTCAGAAVNHVCDIQSTVSKLVLPLAISHALCKACLAYARRLRACVGVCTWQNEQAAAMVNSLQVYPAVQVEM